MFSLTATHLRFVCEALTPIRLPRYEAGSRLRGALGNVMRRAYCTEARMVAPGSRRPADAEHAATCPVCWLLAANEHPGEERRGYALKPMLDPPEAYPPGERFSFGLTLFGDAQRFLPYFILAVPELGRAGVGTGRGQFALRQVWADDPLTGMCEVVLAEGESLVHVPAASVCEERVNAAADRWMKAIEANGQVNLRFLTPMRLVEAEALLKSPDFGVLFARLLHRLDVLSRQFAGGDRRQPAQRIALQTAADQVRLVQASVEWIDVWSGSSRTGDRTPVGGFVGAATYRAPIDVWRPLLPWLIWGETAQVGKDVVKGNGWYRMANAE